MKTLLKISAAALILVATGASAQNITGSAHDFSGIGWGGGEICKACHAPHNNGLEGVRTGQLLWNHQETAATFVVYSNPDSLNAVVGQPTGVSKLCMSCHDGTVALDSYGGGTGATTITGDALVGTDLGNDHPISFTYDTALSGTDGGLHDPATELSGVGTGTIDADMLFSGSMECSSCHDVHNEYNLTNLLVKDNGTSALCLTCHNK